MTTFTTATAARSAGISPATLRNYTRDPRLTPYFSPTAAANPRQLTTEDVRTLKYISTQTAAGKTLDDVAADLDAGHHLDATWSATDQQPQDQDTHTAMIDAALMTMLQTLRDEFTATRARADQLQDQLIDAERRATRAEAELAALKTARRSFWQRLTGR